MLPSPVNVSAKQVLSADSDITGNKEVVDAIEGFLKEMAVLVSKRIVDGWNVPSDLFLCI